MNEKHITSYTVGDLKLIRSHDDRTDWEKVDSMSDEDHEQILAPDEEDLDWAADWSQAVIIVSRASGK
jgi:hypothetical protein